MMLSVWLLATPRSGRARRVSIRIPLRFQRPVFHSAVLKRWLKRPTNIRSHHGGSCRPIFNIFSGGPVAFRTPAIRLSACITKRWSGYALSSIFKAADFFLVLFMRPGSLDGQRRTIILPNPSPPWAHVSAMRTLRTLARETAQPVRAGSAGTRRDNPWHRTLTLSGSVVLLSACGRERDAPTPHRPNRAIRPHAT